MDGHCGRAARDGFAPGRQGGRVLECPCSGRHARTPLVLVLGLMVATVCAAARASEPAPAAGGAPAASGLPLPPAAPVPAREASPAAEVAPFHLEAGLAVVTGLANVYDHYPRLALGADWTAPFGLYVGLQFRELLYPAYPKGALHLACGYGTAPDRRGWGYRGALLGAFEWAGAPEEDVVELQSGFGIRADGWYRFVPEARLALSIRPRSLWLHGHTRLDLAQVGDDVWAFVTDVELAYDGWFSRHFGLKAGLTLTLARGASAPGGVVAWLAPSVLAQFRW